MSRFRLLGAIRDWGSNASLGPPPSPLASSCETWSLGPRDRPLGGREGGAPRGIRAPGSGRAQNWRLCACFGVVQVNVMNVAHRWLATSNAQTWSTPTWAFKFQVFDFKFQVPGFNFQVSNFTFRFFLRSVARFGVRGGHNSGATKRGSFKFRGSSFRVRGSNGRPAHAPKWRRTQVSWR